MLDRLAILYGFFNLKERIKFFQLFLMVVVGAIFEMMAVGLVPLLVMSLTDKDKLIYMLPDWTHLKLTSLSQSEILLQGSILLGSIYLIKTIYMIGVLIYQQKLIYRFMRNLSLGLFKDYLMASYQYHVFTNTAEQIRNLKRTIPVLIVGFLNPLLSLATASTLLIGLVGFILYREPMILLVIGCSLGLGSILFLKFTNKKMYKFGDISQREEKRSIEIVQQGLGSIIEIKLLNKINFFTEKMRRSIVGQTEAAKSSAIVSGAVTPSLEFLGIVTLLIAINLVFLSYSEPSEFFPIISFLLVALIRVRTFLNQITENWTKIQYNSPTIDLIHADRAKIKLYRDYQPEQNLNSTFPDSKLIKFENVSYRFPNSSQIVAKEIDLEIKPGEKIAFIGPTGGGKTTIVNLIAGLLRPSKGSITCDGVDIQNNIEQWQTNIGYVTQNVFLIDDSIENNIAFGEQYIDDVAVLAATEAADLESYISGLVDGMKTRIGEAGAKLSGGQRQRISIARMLYARKSVLIFDEATSALDNLTEQKIINNLVRISNEFKLTLILISHKLNILKDFDKLYFVEDGEVSMSGSYSDLYRTNIKFQQYVNAQSRN